MKTSDYSPVAAVYHEVFTTEQEKEYSSVIFFGKGIELEEAKGKITGLVKKDAFDEYLSFASGEEIRIDRIITINGIPGPAYDEYDSYALACLECSAGMEPEDNELY